MRIDWDFLLISPSFTFRIQFPGSYKTDVKAPVARVAGRREGKGGVRGGGRWLRERNSTSGLSGVYHSLHKFLSNSGTACPGPSWENQEGPERDEWTKAVLSRKELGKEVL